MAACSLHGACAGLAGDCCPTAAGDFLGCCGSSPSVSDVVFGRVRTLMAELSTLVENNKAVAAGALVVVIGLVLWCYCTSRGRPGYQSRNWGHNPRGQPGYQSCNCCEAGQRQLASCKQRALAFAKKMSSCAAVVLVCLVAVAVLFAYLNGWSATYSGWSATYSHMMVAWDRMVASLHKFWSEVSIPVLKSNALVGVAALVVLSMGLVWCCCPKVYKDVYDDGVRRLASCKRWALSFAKQSSTAAVVILGLAAVGLVIYWSQSSSISSYVTVAWDGMVRRIHTLVTELSTFANGHTLTHRLVLAAVALGGSDEASTLTGSTAQCPLTADH